METLHNSSTAYIQPVKQRSFKSAAILANNLLQTFPPWPNGGTVHPLWKKSFFLMRSFLSYNKVSTPKTTWFIQHHLRISLNRNGLFDDVRTQVLWWCGGLSPTMANSPSFSSIRGKNQRRLLPIRNFALAARAKCRRTLSELDWVFQQDSAPAHKAKVNQEWCRTNCPGFISANEWPPSSPDLNPLDFCIWGVLEGRVNAKQHRSIESLKRALAREWDKLSMETVCAAIGSWRKRLEQVIRQNGGQFEWTLLYWLYISSRWIE